MNPDKAHKIVREMIAGEREAGVEGNAYLDDWMLEALESLIEHTFYIVLTEGYDEPELIGPFATEDAASKWAQANLAFESHWLTDIAKATSPEVARL